MPEMLLIDRVKEECKDVVKCFDFIQCFLYEENNKPVVFCKVTIEDLKVPDLILHVSGGYPTIGSVTYELVRHPLGDCLDLGEITALFEDSVDAFQNTCGVGDLLKAWGFAVLEATGEGTYEEQLIS